MTTPSHDRQRELGEFVRAQREKLQPNRIFKASRAARRRRTPGLRREEVAQLCGLSVTWYTWLEQGREMSLSSAQRSRASPRPCGSSHAERAYLSELPSANAIPRAGPAARAERHPRLPCSPAIATIASPAYILDRTWTARGWNAKGERGSSPAGSTATPTATCCANLSRARGHAR